MNIMDIEFKSDTSILDKLFKDSEEYIKEIKSSSSYKCSLCNGTLVKEDIMQNRKASSSCEAQYFDN